MEHQEYPIFKGCAAALVTPFLSDGALDLPALKRLVRMHRQAGTDAIVLLGTTGEPSTISEAEREQIIRAGIEAAEGMPVIVGTGANDTRRAAAYARQAKELGACAQLCVTPYYNKCTQQGLIRHYCTVMDSCELPLIAYHVPSRTGVSVTLDTIRTLSHHPHMAGIKEAGSSIALAADILSSRIGIPLYCGNDDMILPMISMGASGAISVTANLLPAITKSLTDAALSGDYARALEIHNALMPLFRALFWQVNPIPVKAAMSHAGLIREILRLPLTPLEEPHRSRLFALLDTIEAEDSSAHRE